MRFATAILFLCLIIFPTLGAAETPALEELQREQRAIFADVAPSVVFITQGDDMGSGFFVSSEGDILTNDHVVGDASEVRVVLHDGRRITGQVVERAKSLDLALVSIDIDDAPALALAPMDDVQVGDWAAAVGHGMGGIWTYTTGMVSNIYPAGEERPLFQTQIPLNPGNSGGPVVDRRGRAIGVVTAGIIEAQAINFAIPVEQAMSNLDEFSSRCDCLVIELPRGVPVYVNDVMVGVGPRVVLMAETGDYEVIALIDGSPVRKTVSWPGTRTVKMEDQEFVDEDEN